MRSSRRRPPTRLQPRTIQIGSRNSASRGRVLRLKARGHRELVTLVGHAAAISAGEWITAAGNWINDRAHGQQFKARFLKTRALQFVDGGMPP